LQVHSEAESVHFAGIAAVVVVAAVAAFQADSKFLQRPLQQI
jgi:hypothetical protein